MTETKITMEIPPQVREFAGKSVDQAEKAVSLFLDSASKSVPVTPGPMTDVAKQVLAITEANVGFRSWIETESCRRHRLFER